MLFSPFASELIWTIKIVAKHHHQLGTKYNDSLTCLTCTQIWQFYDLDFWCVGSQSNYSYVKCTSQSFGGCD